MSSATDVETHVRMSVGSVRPKNSSEEFSLLQFDCRRGFSSQEVANALAAREELPMIIVLSFPEGPPNTERFGLLLAYLFTLGIPFIGLTMPRGIRPLRDSLSLSHGNVSDPLDLCRRLVDAQTFEPITLRR